MLKETSSARRWFTKGMKEEYVDFAWYNTNSEISVAGIIELQEYATKKDIFKIIVVNNIEMTRPQRTFGSFPEYFRPANECHYFDDYNYDKAFIIALYKKQQKKEIEEALKSFPKKSTIIQINK